MTTGDLIEMIRMLDPDGKGRACIVTRGGGILAITSVSKMNNPDLTKVKVAIEVTDRD